jgi:hypothetical protein
MTTQSVSGSHFKVSETLSFSVRFGVRFSLLNNCNQHQKYVSKHTLLRA